MIKIGKWYKGKIKSSITRGALKLVCERSVL